MFKPNFKMYPYNHKRYLSRGTIGQLKDGTYCIIDSDDTDMGGSLSDPDNQLNYYIFHITGDTIQRDEPEGYDSPRYKMIHYSDIVAYSRQKFVVGE